MIGGVSIFGGAGSVIGVAIGTAAMAVIRNGLVLLQIGASWQLLLTGMVIVIAVAIDGVTSAHSLRAVARVRNRNDKKSKQGVEDEDVRNGS